MRRQCYRPAVIWPNPNGDGGDEGNGNFIETYNRSWWLERLSYMSPIEFRESYLTRVAA